MYRYQTHVQVQLAHWRDFFALVNQLNAALEAKDLAPFQLWESSFGPFNGAMMVADYESLVAYEREHDTMHSDPTCMELWRKIGEHVDSTPWTDLWWRPSKPA